jgi:D-tyrosyl-tRNA(Tyr) deacylase
VRAVIQRVSEARALVAGNVVGRIGPGLCVLLGISKSDTEASAKQLARKIVNLRIFEDEQGKMNRSLAEHHGEVLVVSQFTLYGDCRKGNRPSFSDAAPADSALKLYQEFVEQLREADVGVSTGRFQARMSVALVNDGPVTLLLES